MSRELAPDPSEGLPMQRPRPTTTPHPERPTETMPDFDPELTSLFRRMINKTNTANENYPLFPAAKQNYEYRLYQENCSRRPTSIYFSHNGLMYDAATCRAGAHTSSDSIIVKLIGNILVNKTYENIALALFWPAKLQQ